MAITVAIVCCDFWKMEFFVVSRKRNERTNKKYMGQHSNQNQPKVLVNNLSKCIVMKLNRLAGLRFWLMLFRCDFIQLKYIRSSVLVRWFNSTFMNSICVFVWIVFCFFFLGHDYLLYISCSYFSIDSAELLMDV